MFDLILYLFIFLSSILIYVLINYSLSILGYRTFGLGNDDLNEDESSQKPIENASDTLSYEAYILAIFIRNLILSIGVGSFIIFIILSKIFSDLSNFQIMLASVVYFFLLVLSISISFAWSTV